MTIDSTILLIRYALEQQKLAAKRAIQLAIKKAKVKTNQAAGNSEPEEVTKKEHRTPMESAKDRLKKNMSKKERIAKREEDKKIRLIQEQESEQYGNLVYACINDYD